MMHLRLGMVILALAGCGGAPPTQLPAPDADGPIMVGSAPLSPEAVDSLYADAVRLFRGGKWQQSLDAFNRVGPRLQPEDPRVLRQQFHIAEIHFARGEYLQAVREFRRLSDQHPEHELAPDALFRAGMAQRQLWRKPQLDPSYGEAAQQTFAEVATRYPGTPAAARAQAMGLELQDWFAAKEFRNAEFYIRYKAYDSAILVLREIVASYPRAAVVPRALIAMVESYLALGYNEDRQETCDYIRQYYPAAVGLARVCPAPVAQDP